LPAPLLGRGARSAPARKIPSVWTASSARLALLLVLAPLFVLVPCPAAAHPLLEDRIARLTRAIEADPGEAALWVERGDCYRLDGLWELALADYVQARTLDPELDALDFSLGWLYLETGRADKALPHLDRFVARHPEQPVALLGRARALAALGRAAEVGPAYGSAVDAMRQPKPEHYLEWSRALAAAGEHDLALAVLDAGAARLGAISSLAREAVEIEESRGDLEAAVVRLDALIADSPRPETWLLRKAEMLEQMGKPDQARDALRLALGALESRPPSRRSVPALQELEARIRETLGRLEQAAPLD